METSSIEKSHPSEEPLPVTFMRCEKQVRTEPSGELRTQQAVNQQENNYQPPGTLRVQPGSTS